MNRNTVIITVILVFNFTSSVLGQKVERKGSMKKPFVLSQQFKHSIGAGITFYKYTESHERIFSLAYNPSLSLTRAWSDFSVSVGSQISGGYHFSSDIDKNDFVYADLPLLIEMNFGHNASKDFYNDLGGFFGGGYSYHLLNEEWNHGPVATVGVRAFFLGPSISIRYSRYFAIQETDASLHTVALLLNLGKYFEQVKLNNKVSRFTNSKR